MENLMTGQNSKVMPVMVVLLIGAAFFLGNLSAKVSYLEKNGSGTTNTGTVANNNQPAAPAPVTEIDGDKFEQIAKGDNVIGDKNAKVTLVEFSDFECPFCKRFYDDAYKQIKEQYVKSGKVKIVFRHLPLTAIHPKAMGAAIASECAAEQGKFEAYHDKLFEKQPALAVEDLKTYAKEVGLNTSKFNSCLDSEKYKAKVEADMKLAGEVGANGTPTSFVNGKVVNGAQPFDSFKTVIDAAI